MAVSTNWGSFLRVSLSQEPYHFELILGYTEAPDFGKPPFGGPSGAPVTGS